MRISLRHSDFDGVGRLLLGNSGEEEQRADDHDDDDDEHEHSGHGVAFAERESRCIAPSRDATG
jgi:hypothetical protein